MIFVILYFYVLTEKEHLLLNCLFTVKNIYIYHSEYNNTIFQIIYNRDLNMSMAPFPSALRIYFI